MERKPSECGATSYERLMWELLDRQAAITERDFHYVREQAERYAIEAKYWEDEAVYLREVVRTKANSLAKLEAENARLRKNGDSSEKLVELAKENAKLRERAERAERKISRQREEIASFTFRKNVDRMAPKKLKRFQWPRFASGRKVRPGKDCSEVVFGQTGYSLWATDGSDEFGAAYGKSVPDSWKEREWLRGDA